MWIDFRQILIAEGGDYYLVVNRSGEAQSGDALPSAEAREIVGEWLLRPEGEPLRRLAADMLGLAQGTWLDDSAWARLTEGVSRELDELVGSLTVVKLPQTAITQALLARPPLDVSDNMWAAATNPYITVEAGPSEAAAETIEIQENVVDWKLECEHHASAQREIFERGNRIQVVPDKGETLDIVKVSYRNDLEPTPPHLELRGAETGRVPKSGSAGAYDVYDFEANYLGDIDQKLFILPEFWRAYTERSSYTLTGAPSPVAVEVFHPRHYKFEFKFPPLKKVKAGTRLEKRVKVENNKPVVRGDYEEIWKIESIDWSPSSLTVDRWKDKSTYDDERRGKEAFSLKNQVVGGIAFSIDDAKVDIDVLKILFAIFHFYTQFMEIVSAIKENIPLKVGWYIDFNLQLMQGGLAIEWYWKEHTDQRVYQYIDFNIQLQVFNITLDFGIGITGLGFRAQVFVQLGGSLAISANARRTGPDGAPGFGIPAEGLIKGALGARFEVGNLFKAEGKGESGIKGNFEIGVNRGRGKIFNLDAYATWTGLRVEATVSGGLFGIGPNKKWERQLIGPRRLGGFQWPEPTKYEPPYLGHSRIKAVLLGVLTKGLNVRVIRPVPGLLRSNVHWKPDQIAQALADKIDQHTTFHRTAKMVDGLAHSIRKDLDELGSRWLRDWVEENAFIEYVNGPKLQEHLDSMVNPVNELANELGG